MVHPRRDAVFLRRARGVHRELGDVRARRRVPRRERSDGRHDGEVVGVGAAVRLRPHGSDQRRVGGAVSRRPHQRPLDAIRIWVARALQRRRDGAGAPGHDLLLVAQHTGPARVERRCVEDHADHDGDGGHPRGLVRRHAAPSWRADAAAADAQNDRVFKRRSRLAARHALADVHGNRDPRRVRSFDSGHERRGIARAGLSGDRTAESEESRTDGNDHLPVQPDLHVARQLLRGRDHSRLRPAEILRQPDFRPGDEPGRARMGTPAVPGLSWSWASSFWRAP